MLTSTCRGTIWQLIGPPVICLLSELPVPLVGQDRPIYPVEPGSEQPVSVSQGFDLVFLADDPVTRPTEQGTLELVKDPADGKSSFLVLGQQAGMRIEEPAFITAESSVLWSWKKDQGNVVIVQIGIKNPATGQHRYLGYAAGAWSEAPSADPTVEVFVSGELPQQWSTVTRPLHEDIKKVLGWERRRSCPSLPRRGTGSPHCFAMPKYAA